MSADRWPGPADTPLQRARKIAGSYRAALHQLDPGRCADLDRRAVELGQGWIAPVELPAHLSEHALDAELSAADIEHFWRIPASTIRTWAHRGLITSRPGKKYLVRDVLVVSAQATNRRRGPAHRVTAVLNRGPVPPGKGCASDRSKDADHQAFEGKAAEHRPLATLSPGQIVCRTRFPRRRPSRPLSGCN
ncbi:hypothetical protein IU494_30355 [Nocardia terpenica]|uniref:hypothetical protein n=1 Tax=Nocardia terpenica TaxID=455432 RepID=UPI0018963BA2|nr:hypothetical protein [Nocardia terpenica]MBF6064951.1 hypothetical protein [Nocardia terpenica]MBF6115223.1 hypothetical protein [Nocardia terpenica]MBF6122545.1 hypothetical protein [Nocardia terpenica]